MGNNKQYKDIDSLFQSLAQGEDHAHSGSWRDMKSLLDKEMPIDSTQTAFLPKYLKIGLPILAFLLLGVGYLYWNQKAEISNKLVTAPVDIQKTPSSLPETDDETIIALTEPKEATEKNRPTTTANTSSNKNNPAASVWPVTHPSSLSSNKIKHQTGGTNFEESFNKKQEGLKIADSKGNRLNQKTPGSKNKTDDTRADLNSIMNLLTASESKQIDLQDETVLSLNQRQIAKQKDLPRFEATQKLSASSGEQAPLEAKTLAKENGLEELWPKNSQEPIYQNGEGQLYQAQKDTFLQVKLKPITDFRRTRTAKHKTSYDTLAQYQMARLSLIPLSFEEINLLANNQGATNPQALLLASNANRLNAALANKMNRKIEHNWKSLSDSKVTLVSQKKEQKKKFLGIPYLLSKWFDGSKAWSAAIMTGGNTGLSAPSSRYGGQIGLAFNYSLSERWSLSPQFFYQNNLFSNLQFQDIAYQYLLTVEPFQGTPTGGTHYYGTEITGTKTFQVTGLSRLMLPILMSYDLGRTSLYAGPQLNYFFAPKESHQEALHSESVSRVTYNQEGNPFQNQNYLLDVASDFRARLGLAYTFGVSYDFSKNFSVDFRFHQNIWESTAPYKVKAVRQIYRQPSLELNFGFYLGRREKVLYMMNQF